jgi:hypothetical protein
MTQPLSEGRLRALGLSSTSREALSPEARAAITRVAELAARELCAAQHLRGITGVAVNLLGDRTQLNAALAGPLRTLAEDSGLLERWRVVPLSVTVCIHVVANADGYLDLSDGERAPQELLAHFSAASGGALKAYLGVALEIEGVRVGTLCIYGTESASADMRDAREAAIRRYGALLSQQLTEAARLRTENAALRAELRGTRATNDNGGRWRRCRGLARGRGHSR